MSSQQQQQQEGASSRGQGTASNNRNGMDNMIHFPQQQQQLLQQRQLASAVSPNATKRQKTGFPYPRQQPIAPASMRAATPGTGHHLPLVHLATPNPAACGTQHTPAVFMNSKLRSGKWIPQEEEYAEVLIDLFEQGQVSDCENGVTLRAYLSQRLHCAPMRISKKYAGKGIGKKVYVGREKDEQGRKLLEKVKVAEEKFYKAVFPLNDPILGAVNLFKNPSLPMFVPMFAHGHPALAQMQLPANLVKNVLPAVGGNPMIPQIASVPPTNTTTKKPTAKPASSHIKPTQSAPPARREASKDTSELRQSFLNALHQTSDSSKNALTAKPAPPPNTKREDLTVKTLVPQDSAKQQAMELPDFLAGFDNAANPAKSDRAPSQAPFNDAHQFSPTYTTRSFDDLHCLLGKDLPPPMESVAKSTGPTRLQPRSTRQQSAESKALFTAESYAVFAQESARAASQHDAYSTGKVWNSSVHPPTETFDIDDMVKLVSEHVGGTQPTTSSGQPTYWPIEPPPQPRQTLAQPSLVNSSVVSASEHATETESNVSSSFRDSASGSDTNTDNYSGSEGNADNGSDSDDATQSLKRRRSEMIDGIEAHPI